MNNNASQTKAEAARNIEVGTSQEQIEFLVNLPEDNVSKILSASASVVIDKYEALLGELSFSGEACLNLVYSLDDGTMANYKTCQEFSRKFENLFFDPSSLVNILPKVLDVSVEKGANNTLKVKLTIENSFSVLKNQEINVFQNQDADVFVKESEIKLSKQKERNCHTFNQPSVFETKLPVGKILNTTSGVVITKADALDGTVVFEGETITKLLYVTNDDRPLLVSLINKDMFREEVENSNANREDMVDGYAIVLGKDIEESIDEDTKTVEVTVPVKICYDLYQAETINVTADAYSTEAQLNLTTEAFITTNVVGCETFTNKIEGNLSLGEQVPRIDKVLAVDGAYLTPTNETIENGELLSEGTVHLNLIYLNDEEENINAVSLEFPYSFTEKIGNENVTIARSSNEIIELDATVKRGRDIYIDGKIKTTLWFIFDEENAVVSGAEKGEKLKPRDGAIEIFFAQEGKTFWDVAKELKVSENLLKDQNQEIVEPFAKTEKIVFFDQRQIEIE